MTKKDIADVDLGAKLGVDFVALSFVRKATDLKELRDFLLNGIKTARRLLLELRLAGADMLYVFEEWRAWRGSNKAGLSRDDLAAYYASDSFPHDLLEFVKTQYLSESKAPAEVSA